MTELANIAQYQLSLLLDVLSNCPVRVHPNLAGAEEPPDRPLELHAMGIRCKRTGHRRCS